MCVGPLTPSALVINVRRSLNSPVCRSSLARSRSCRCYGCLVFEASSRRTNQRGVEAYMRLANKVALSILFIAACGGQTLTSLDGNGSGTGAGSSGGGGGSSVSGGGGSTGSGTSGSTPPSSGIGSSGGSSTGSAPGSSVGSGGGGSSTTITCGTTTCDSTTQECCLSFMGGSSCAPTGQCQGGASLSCSSGANCASGEVCCATLSGGGASASC
jgi:hypothetical protein